MNISYYPILYIHNIYNIIYIYIYIYIYINFVFFVYSNIVGTHTHAGHTGFTFR